jgi:nitrite reductase/ring-hydroxylating ferredoxin subunit
MKRSRLDPAPVSRRDLLGLAATWSAISALAAALFGALRLPRAAVLPSPSKRFRVTLPESLPPGEPFLPPGRAVAIFRDEDGVHAVSAVCTHLGCVVKRSAGGFDCPCHGSRFAPDGSVIQGPAPKALPWLRCSLDSGAVIVDEGETVPTGTKVKT